LGATRVNTARELTLEEIRRITAESGIDVEAFVHGRHVHGLLRPLPAVRLYEQPGEQRGMCSQPCRFRYTLMEQKRPGQYFPIEEDPRGAYLFNSGIFA
jgi:putative protease